jgi:diguanylate cyclase (GGDEF)-like protein
MSLSLDLATLRLCSLIASITFVVIFLSLWRGRKDQSHYLYWAVSLLLYCAALAGLEWVNRPDDVLIRSLLLAVLTGSNIPVIIGVRVFAAQPIWRSWMAIPPAATLTGFLLPHFVGVLGISWPVQSEQILATFGLVLGMGIFGWDIVRQSDCSVPNGYGGRIAGLAMTAYIPCYLFAIVGEVFDWATPSTLAVSALLSDQILLMLLNLGLLAMPAEAALAALRESAWRDALTGVYNRAWLATAGEAFLKPGTRLAHIDVDHFKTINDRFGHAAGDAALVDLAGALVAAAQDIDLKFKGQVVRMGGDEFLVIMPHASLLAAQQLVQHVSSAVSSLGPLRWTVSTGLAVVEPQDVSLSDAVERADARLYAAKLAGRNRVAA